MALDEAEMHHRMHKWYNSPECDALRAAWGAYPAAPGALQAWPGFVAVTNAFLDYEAAHGRSGEPVAAEAEESELVVAGEVVPEVVEGEEGVVTEPVVASETMERETPAEGAADEPGGWFSSLREPRREGATANTAGAHERAVSGSGARDLCSREGDRTGWLARREHHVCRRDQCADDAAHAAADARSSWHATRRARRGAEL